MSPTQAPPQSPTQGLSQPVGQSAPDSDTLRVGTRASALALTQSGLVADALSTALGRPVRLVEITTQGDIDPRAVTEFGGAGVFVTALRTALVTGTVDVAVHSLKDLPVEVPADVILAAVPVREDPADVLVTRDHVALEALPPGSTVGTGSPRRATQLLALRPDLTVVAIRGNVDTRVAAVTSGRVDAVLIARAGLARLGRLSDVAYTFSPDELLPAPGQGALAVEVRAADVELAAAVGDALDDWATRVAVTAERAVLAGLAAGCSAPVGALASLETAAAGATLRLHASVGGTLRVAGAAVVGPPPTGPREKHKQLDPAYALGQELAARLLAAGAGSQMETTNAMGQH